MWQYMSTCFGEPHLAHPSVGLHIHDSIYTVLGQQQTNQDAKENRVHESHDSPALRR